jgi:agmatinase
MALPFTYDAGESLMFCGPVPQPRTFDQSRAVVLPIPLDRTTSYVPGTRNGPREILLASSHMELWDEEMNVDVHQAGIFTLPEMELPFGGMEEALAEIRRVTEAILDCGKFPLVLGGEHSLTPPVVSALAKRHPGLSVLQIDAHADLRDAYMGSPLSHACAMRRVLEVAPCTQVGIRSLSSEEAAAIPSLSTRIFFDVTMRQDARWIDRVVESLSEDVYVTIDCDGLNPAIMPAVGTPEPGGLDWYEILTLLRRVIESRRLVGADLVELCPIPGLMAPNFLCAKLACKILAYRFARQAGEPIR